MVDAPNSIYPKNWKLPTAGRSTLASLSSYGFSYDRDDSYYALLVAYGYGRRQVAYELNNGNTYTFVLNELGKNLYAAPVYLLLQGTLHPLQSWVRNGVSGGIWSSTPYPDGVYKFYLGYALNGAWGDGVLGTVVPSDGFSGFHGLGVRCLAR